MAMKTLSQRLTLGGWMGGLGAEEDAEIGCGQ